MFYAQFLGSVPFEEIGSKIGNFCMEIFYRERCKFGFLRYVFFRFLYVLEIFEVRRV